MLCQGEDVETVTFNSFIKHCNILRVDVQSVCVCAFQAYKIHSIYHRVCFLLPQRATRIPQIIARYNYWKNKLRSSKPYDWNTENKNKMYHFHSLPQKYIKSTVRKAYSTKLPLTSSSKASGANNTRNKTTVMIDRSVNDSYHLFPTLSVKYVPFILSEEKRVNFLLASTFEVSFRFLFWNLIKIWMYSKSKSNWE